MTRKYFYSNRLRHAIPFAAASFTVGLALFACSDKDIDSNENNGKALVAFNVSETQDQAQAAAKSNQPMTRAAFANQLALQNLAPEDLTMQKLPVQGKAGAGLCLIETTLPGVPSQREATAQTRADITTMTTMQNFSTTAFYGSSDTSLEPWFYDKDTKKDGNLVAPIYWDWIKNHACFYAVYPKPYSKLQLSPSTYAGTPYVDFEVEPNVKNQKDLMTACSGKVHTDIGAMSATAPRTDLTFRHALTAVRFKVGENLSYSKHITKVEIVGAKSKGKYVLPTDKNHTGSWDATSLSTPATFTLGGDGTVSVSTSEAVNNIIVGKPGDNYVFYMIPQTLTGVQARFYFDGATTPAITVSLPGKWKPGTTKTYALSQNTSSWQYVLTATGPTPAEYNTTTTDNYKIESYREDPVSHTQQKVAWKVVGYDTDGDGTFAMTEPWPNWFKGISMTSGDGGTSGETGTATLQAATLIGLTERNAALKLNPKGSSSDYYDLSTHDVKGNSTLRNTANCYIISHPGYYKIPLVYGNAITSGATNTNAYISQAPTGTPNESFILRHFKDHNNQDITDPWITQSNGGVNAPDGAKLVWGDESGLVTNLAVTGSGTDAFVQFEVPAATIKNGNAVIAVTKGGTVVWSWHLWFINDDALNTTACWNYQNKRYDFSEESLGMKYTSWSSTTYSKPRSIKVKVVQTNGQGSPMVPEESILTITQKPIKTRVGFTTFYQFGRKDALPGTFTGLVGTFNNDAGNNMSISNGIQHPENYYTNGSSWNSTPPAGYSWYNLWSANNTTTDLNDNTVVKTVYDPCPAGFKLPAPKAFSGFTTDGIMGKNVTGLWNSGWNFNNKPTNPNATVYFPAAGSFDYIGKTSTFQHGLGSGGNYWMAIPYPYSGGAYPHSNGRILYFNGVNLSIDMDRDYSAGLTVRPVADN